jgi:D-alanyl-lipoteichoic acid acyltransferase DltB (MBOAT superfamily)
MLFNSFEYVLFLVLVFLAFWAVVRYRMLRLVLLLVASYLFYMGWNATFVLLIIASTVADYYCGLWMGVVENPRGRTALLAASLVYNLGVLGVFKYADFFIGATTEALALGGIEVTPHYLRLVLPAGISFYTFQSLSYTIDVYRRKIEPSRSFVEFATYVAFFPQLVAGPIVRAKEFMPQFRHTPRLSRQQAGEALFLILVGMLKKVVIADHLAADYLDQVFDDPMTHSSTEAWLAIYGYSWQLYGDFSGYTDIARGSAKLFGFELPENFSRPWRSTGPIEFWRTWHMTLGRWVQDYIYVPLGGSKKGRVRTYINLAVCFFAVGIWHGAGWAYVIFALMQSIGVTVNRIWRDIWKVEGPPPFGPKAIGLNVLTHIFFALSWSVFRPASLGHMRDLHHQLIAGEWWPIQIGPWSWVVLVGMPVLHFTPVEWVDRAQRALGRAPVLAQVLVAALVAALVAHVSSHQPTPFIYFQF